MSTRHRPVRRRQHAPLQASATWIAARARNALRRPKPIGIVSALTFAVTLAALAIVPQQAHKAAAAIRPVDVPRPDTEPTVNAQTAAERRAATAESTYAQRKAQLAQMTAPAAASSVLDTSTRTIASPTDARRARDSIASQIAVLGRLISRAENAPLPSSYRALAQAAPMQGEPRIKPLLDSLVEIEHERESYSAVGGVDPAFVALTARANEVGRSMESVADARRATLRSQMASLGPATSTVPAAVAAATLPDTATPARERDLARATATIQSTLLSRQRSVLLQLDGREERARELGSVGASPWAILATAALFGAVLGFGIALNDEVRHPRLADAREAERATGVRVLGEIRVLEASPERGRRSTDRLAPPYIDPGADGHQLIYLTIATAGASTIMLTVTGDKPGVAAVVAINFAAIGAAEGRSTLLVDEDGATSSVAAALQIPNNTGIHGIAAARATWTDVTQSVRLGRDRTVDVVPSGADTASVAELSALLERDATDLTRKYDAVVLVGALAQVVAGLPNALPITDVVYCARVGRTGIADLVRAMDDIGKSGAILRGIVFWNAQDPVVPAYRMTTSVEREKADVGV